MSIKMLPNDSTFVLMSVVYYSKVLGAQWEVLVVGAFELLLVEYRELHILPVIS